MAKIAFILLCHKDPEAIIKQAERLTAVGDYMSIHFDARANPDHFEMIKSALEGNPNVAFAKKRIKCGWGEWSLVQATLYAVEAAVDTFPAPRIFTCCQGTVWPSNLPNTPMSSLIVPMSTMSKALTILKVTGSRRHERRAAHLSPLLQRADPERRFYAAFNFQRKLGLTRKIPDDLQIQIGSQWWCLRRRTVEWILDFTKKRRDVMRFFKTTWIPDETFFQTLVRHLVPENEIQTRTLTFLMFTDYGLPVTFYNDHYDLLLSQDYIFARKISPEAKELKRRLGLLYATRGSDFKISNEGASLFKFLTGRGRVGRRFGLRFWENEGSLGREREMLIVVCKKWHVAKRLVERIRKMTNVPCIEYLFNEEGTALPDLGGIQSTMGKRHRHRRALVRMLFDYYETDQLVVCIDPSNLDLLQDFCADRSKTRLLEIECRFSDEYLTGHARRVGLAGEKTPKETLERLLPTIRADMVHESDELRDANFDGHFRIRETESIEANAAALAQFLAATPEKAYEIANIDYLFAD